MERVELACCAFDYCACECAPVEGCVGCDGCDEEFACEDCGEEEFAAVVGYGEEDVDDVVGEGCGGCGEDGEPAMPCHKPFERLDSSPCLVAYQYSAAFEEPEENKLRRRRSRSACQRRWKRVKPSSHHGDDDGRDVGA